MPSYKIKNKIYFYYFLLITLIYPFFHHIFVFSFTFVLSNLFDYESPHFNLILLGWKEGFLGLILILIFLKNYRELNFLFLLPLITLIYSKNILFLKEIYFSFLAVYLAYFYQKKIQIIFNEHKHTFYKIFFYLIIILFSLGLWDLFVRIANYNKFDNLIMLNKIKCSKSAITSSLAFYNDCVYGSFSNFYKILSKDGFLYRQQVLFFPIGDSVTFSYLNFYLILILLYFRSLNIFDNRIIDITLFFLVLGQFLTFNRINILFSLLIYFYFCLKHKKIISLLITSLIYLYNIEIYFLSFINMSLPSNLGHLYAIMNLLSIENNFNSNFLIIIIIGVVIFVTFVYLLTKIKISENLINIVFFSMIFIFLEIFNFNTSFFGSSKSITTESNLLKIIYNYGYFGLFFYSIIITKIISNLRQSSIYTKILSINLLTYQFVSPYIISGFIIFYPALIIMIIFKDKFQK